MSSARRNAFPGLASCKRVAADTFRFVYEERSTGPVSLSVQYTARYATDGRATISFASTAAKGDNTDVDGELRLQKSGAGATKITLRQTLAPDTPVPRLLQGLDPWHGGNGSRSRGGRNI